MPKKIGGGDKLEEYNPENGEYVRNPQCEADEKHLVYNKLFNLELDKPIAYPIYGIHDNQYCELIVKYCLNTTYPNIPDSKIYNYLLLYREKNDKSLLLNKLGYTIENANELYYQLIRGTNFARKKFKSFDKYALTFNVETKIYNKNSGKIYSFTTSWKVNKDFTVNFITLIPEEFKYEN